MGRCRQHTVHTPTAQDWSLSRFRNPDIAEALRSQGHVIVELRTKNSDGGGSGTNPLGVAFHPEVERSETVLPGFGDAFGLFAKILGADGTMHFQREVCQSLLGFMSFFFGTFLAQTLTSFFF